MTTEEKARRCQELVWMSAQVDVCLDQALRDLAAKLRISRSEAQRRAVIQFIEQHEKGVAYEKDEFEWEHKHLRVGINTAHVDHAALAGLLIKKGIITQEEYMDALVEAMEAEVKRYEAHLSKIYGANITLR